MEVDGGIEFVGVKVGELSECKRDDDDMACCK